MRQRFNDRLKAENKRLREAVAESYAAGKRVAQEVLAEKAKFRAALERYANPDFYEREGDLYSKEARDALGGGRLTAHTAAAQQNEDNERGTWREGRRPCKR